MRATNDLSLLLTMAEDYNSQGKQARCSMKSSVNQKGLHHPLLGHDGGYEDLP